MPETPSILMAFVGFSSSGDSYTVVPVSGWARWGGDGNPRNFLGNFKDLHINLQGNFLGFL